jgi:hypothetical protein
LDARQFVLGQQFRLDFLDAQRGADGDCHTLRIAREQDRSDTHPVQGFDSTLGFGSDGIRDRDGAQQAAVTGDKDFGAGRKVRARGGGQADPILGHPDLVAD